MKKKILTLLVFCFCIQATLSAQTLILHHANGTTTDVELLTQPQVKFENDKVLITSTVLNMEYPKENVLSFTFKGKHSGIINPIEIAKYTNEGGQIVIHGIKNSKKIAIYNTKGILIPVKFRRNGDAVSFPLSSIPSGVHILNVNGKTSKFTKP